jgi:ketosteroid isomerase-like protein
MTGARSWFRPRRCLSWHAYETRSCAGLARARPPSSSSSASAGCPCRMTRSRLSGFGRGHTDPPTVGDTARTVERCWPTSQPLARRLSERSFPRDTAWAMSRENVEIVGRGLDAFSRGDLEGILDDLAPEFEFQPSGRFMDTQRVYRGTAGFVEFWGAFRAAWEEITVTIERMEDLDDRVLTLGTFHGRGGGSGVEVNAEAAWPHDQGRADRAPALVQHLERGSRSRRAAGVGQGLGSHGSHPCPWWPR